MNESNWFETTVLEHERDEESYNFNIVGVSKRPDGKLFWSTDSGCSCPSPWETHTEADWKPLPETWDEFEKEAGDGGTDPTEFLAQAKKLLGG